MATSKNIVDGFPALKKLGFPTGRRAVPFVQQLEWTDCGAASLCMVMAYHGREAKLAEVRDAMGIGRDGVSAKAILDTAERYGLTGRGIKVDVSQIHLVKTGTILHWEFNHFLVFERLVKGGVRVVDPATGPRDVTMTDFAKAFTGVPIELTVTPARAWSVEGPLAERAHACALRFCEALGIRAAFHLRIERVSPVVDDDVIFLA